MFRAVFVCVFTTVFKRVFGGVKYVPCILKYVRHNPKYVRHIFSLLPCGINALETSFQFLHSKTPVFVPRFCVSLCLFSNKTHILYMNFAHMPCKGGISRKNVVNLRAKY